MTHPLTPREKVARIIDPKAYDAFDRVSEYQSRPQEEAPWSKFWADLCWYAKNETDAALNKADAILSTLASGSGDHAELARLVESLRRGKVSQGDRIRVATLSEALLAENAALRDYGKSAAREAVDYRRKLAEAVGVLRDLSSWFDGAAHNGVWIIRSGDLGADDAICAARTFLSKEAERG